MNATEQECVVFGCRNSSIPLRQKKTDCCFFGFPLNEKNLRDKWLRKLNLEGWIPGPENVVCEEHFSSDSFEISSNRIILKSDAVPNNVNEWNQLLWGTNSVNEEYINELDESGTIHDNELRCRICARFLSPKNAVDIYSKNENILEKIMTCIPILMQKEENLPKHICRLCLCDLNISYRMLIRAIESEKLFHCYLSKDLEKSNIRETPLKSDDKKEIPEASMFCVMCNIQFKDTSELNIHLREQHIYEVDFSSYLTEIDLVEEAVFQEESCSIVNKEIEGNDITESADHLLDKNLNSESRTVEVCSLVHKSGEVSEFQCQDAKKQDVNYQQISYDESKELDLMKNLEQYFPCQYCAETFESKEMLHHHTENHFQSVLCDVCGFMCDDYKRMVKHRDIHKKREVSKTNACQICFTVFPTHVEMMQHSKEVHRLKEIKDDAIVPSLKWICKFCGKEIGSKLSLSIHERVHTGARPFVCECCGQTFKSKANLIQHQPVHTGIKRYKCSVCSKAFARKAFVNTHMRVHTGERPYICDICGNSYTQIGDMRRHKKRHSVIKSLAECVSDGENFTACYSPRKKQLISIITRFKNNSN